jgi:hypothetical protein
MSEKRSTCFVCGSPRPPYVYYFDDGETEEHIAYCTTICLKKYFKDKTEEASTESGDSGI